MKLTPINAAISVAHSMPKLADAGIEDVIAAGQFPDGRGAIIRNDRSRSAMVHVFDFGVTHTFCRDRAVTTTMSRRTGCSRDQAHRL
ncbi:MAG: hypothetical protein QOF70_6805 [Acetobacteraceae bacterium]|nr:hypothetical protein [Acetobacteraceae bacterium]